MNCDGVRVLLSAYLDGELSSGELLRVEQHLRRCHSCADDVGSLRQTIALVASMDEVVIPATFHAQLHNRLVALGPPVPAVRRIPVAPGWQRNLGRWAVPAAAAAAALAVGLTSLPHAKDLLPGLEGTPSNFSVAKTPQTADNTPAKPPVNSLLPSQDGKPLSFGKAPGPDQASPPKNVPVQPGGPIDPGPAPSNLDYPPAVGQPPAVNPPPAVSRPPAVSPPPGTPPVNPGTPAAKEPVPSHGTESFPTGTGTGGTAATPGPVQPPPAALTPKWSITSVATVTTASAENLTRALAAFHPNLQGDTVTVTLPSGQRKAVEDAIKNASGVQVVSGFEVRQLDLADSIHRLEATIAAYRQQADNLEKQIPRLKGQEQEDALAQYQAWTDQIRHESETLEIVNSQVDMAIITVHMKVQGR